MSEVDVDVETGELYNTEYHEKEIFENARVLYETLPPFKASTVDERFLATHLKPTHKRGETTGNIFDILAEIEDS